MAHVAAGQATTTTRRSGRHPRGELTWAIHVLTAELHRRLPDNPKDGSGAAS